MEEDDEVGIGNPLLEQRQQKGLSEDRHHSHHRFSHSRDRLISDALIGTYSHHSLQALDDECQSRLLMQSTFSQRFSFVNPNNSAALSTFLLLNSMIGSGILNQPYVFASSGILGGVM